MAQTLIARLGGGLFDHDGKAGAALITPDAFEKVSKILTVGVPSLTEVAVIPPSVNPYGAR